MHTEDIGIALTGASETLLAPGQDGGTARVMIKALSRRTFLQFTGAGAAVALPAATGAAFPKVESAPLTDEQALDACIGQLKNILARMHPTAKPAGHGLNSEMDGGFYFYVKAQPVYRDFEGDGFYLVSIQGNPIPFWLEETDVRALSGKFLYREIKAYQWVEYPYSGGKSYFVEPQSIGEPNIIRKLDMPPGVTVEDIPFHLARS